MKEWTDEKLGDVLTVKYGKDHKTLDAGKIPVLGSGGVMRYADKSLYDKKSILIPRKGSLNNIMYRDEPFWTVDTMFWTIVDEDKVIPKYLFYQLTQIDFNNLNVGSAVPSLTVPVINEIDVTLPPLPEQKAIASVLSSLDDKIDLLHRQNKTLEAMAETLFKEWFVVNAKDGWKTTTLAEQSEVFRGLSYKGAGLTNKGLGIPMHNLNSVYEGGGYKLNGIKYYSGEYKERHITYPGDIIITNTEQGHEHKLIGCPAIVPHSFGKMGIFSQHIYKLLPSSNSYLTNEYLYYLLLSPLMREQIIAATNGSTVNMLAIDGLQRPKFNLPPKELIQKFTEIVRPFWNKKSTNNYQIETVTKLRDTLLPKLMSGEVRVKMQNQLNYVLSNPILQKS